MANKHLKGVVKYLSGFVFSKKGKQIETQREAWREEAKCGCGIDCCYKALVLRDQTTGEATYIYVDNGQVLTTTDPKGTLNKD